MNLYFLNFFNVIRICYAKLNYYSVIKLFSIFRELFKTESIIKKNTKWIMIGFLLAKPDKK